jgi:hypothetical protein
MKGWKKLVLSTLTSISIESGANHESRCGAVAYGGGIVVVGLEEDESELFEVDAIDCATGRSGSRSPRCRQITRL